MAIFGHASPFRRVGVGALTLAVALAALAWTGSMARVALEFGHLPEVSETGIPSAAARDAYAAILLRLAAKDPANVDVRKRLAVVLAQQQRHALAKQEMERAMTTRPAPDGLYFLASADDKLGLIDEASEMTRQATILDPANRAYRDFGLRLLSDRFARQVLAPVQGGERAMAKDRELLAERRGELGVAALDWAIRAPGDKNAFFSLANFYVGPPLNSLLAYRCFLAGLSLSLGADAAAPFMIHPRDIIDGPVRQIIDNGLAKPHPGIDLTAARLERSR
jgi:hypothetical protein